MPVAIKSSRMEYKDDNGNYIGVDAVSERTTAEQVAEIEAAGDAKVQLIQDKADAVTAQLANAAEVRNMLAGVFDPNKSYVAGQYVIQTISDVNKLFRFIADHPAGNWIGTDAVEVKLANDVTDLKSALSDGNIVSLASITGKYVNGRGEEVTKAVLRCSDYITIPEDAIGVRMYCRYYAGSSNPYATFAPLFVIADETKTEFNSVKISTSGVTEDENHIATYMFESGAGFDSKKYIRFNQSNKSEDNNVRWFEFIRFSFRDILFNIKNLSVASNPNLNSYDGIDVHGLEPNKVYGRHSIVSGIQPLNLPFNSWLGDIIVVSAFPSGISGRFFIAISSFGSVYVKLSWGEQATFSDWKQLYGENEKDYFLTAMGGSLDGKDMHNLSPNKLFHRTSSSVITSNLPYSDWLGTALCLRATVGNISNTFVLAMSKANELHMCCCWGVNETWSEWVKIAKYDDSIVESGFVGRYVGQFVSHHQQITIQDIVLKANKAYVVRINTRTRKDWTIFGTGNNNNYKRISPDDDYVRFQNDGTIRYLNIYNIGSTSDDETFDSIDIEVYENDSPQLKFFSTPKKYIVNKTFPKGDYTSLTQCLWDLKDDFDPKIIEIEEGDYDIYDEYQSLVWTDIDPETGEPYQRTGFRIYEGNDPSGDYFDYCVWVPKNTHIIGKGIVRLKWMPDPNEDEITANQCRCVSPLNVADTCTIENLEIYCKNGRYCLHNDGLGKAQFFGSRQHYINCRFYKYINDKDANNVNYGFQPTTGFGIDRSQHHIYENCTFVQYANSRGFYGHSRIATSGNNNESPDITFINCVVIRKYLLKCITAITTPGAWNSAYWENAIPDDSVSDARIAEMLANARNFSSSETYDVGDVIYGSTSEPMIKFGNSATNPKGIRIRTMFNGTHVAGLIHSLREGGEQACKNAFDMQFLNCGNVSVKISDSENQYPPKAYNTNLTVV